MIIFPLEKLKRVYCPPAWCVFMRVVDSSYSRFRLFATYYIVSLEATVVILDHPYTGMVTVASSTYLCIDGLYDAVLKDISIQTIPLLTSISSYFSRRVGASWTWMLELFYAIPRCYQWHRKLDGSSPLQYRKYILGSSISESLPVPLRRHMSSTHDCLLPLLGIQEDWGDFTPSEFPLTRVLDPWCSCDYWT